MKLTPENKAHIDSLSYYGLLSHWRFAPVGDPWFEGETGEYWSKRLSEKRQETSDNGVSDSKALGWGK